MHAWSLHKPMGIYINTRRYTLVQHGFCFFKLGCIGLTYNYITTIYMQQSLRVSTALHWFTSVNQCKVSYLVGRNYIPNTEGPGSASSSTTGTRLGSGSTPAENTNVSICLPIPDVVLLDATHKVASTSSSKIGYSFRWCYLLVKFFFLFFFSSFLSLFSLVVHN